MQSLPLDCWLKQRKRRPSPQGGEHDRNSAAGVGKGTDRNQDNCITDFIQWDTPQGSPWHGDTPERVRFDWRPWSLYTWDMVSTTRWESVWKHPSAIHDTLIGCWRSRSPNVELMGAFKASYFTPDSAVKVFRLTGWLTWKVERLDQMLTPIPFGWL